MCGGHHIAAGGGKLHELGGTILGLEGGDVRGDVVNLLVRFRVTDIGKALQSTQDLSLLIAAMPTLSGKLQGCRITLVKKRCAWYLRVKLRPHSDCIGIVAECISIVQEEKKPRFRWLPSTTFA